MIWPSLRRAGRATRGGAGIVLMLIRWVWALAVLGVMTICLYELLKRMGWPTWIVWPVIICLVIGWDEVFYTALGVVTVAGFFYGSARAVSFITLGVVVAATVSGFLLNWLQAALWRSAAQAEGLDQVDGPPS